MTTIAGREVILAYICPPIPVRSSDWMAHFSDNDLGDPQGFGGTAAEALADLQEQIENREAL